MDEKSPDPPKTNGHIRGKKALELMRQATANMPPPGEVPQRDFADYVPQQVEKDRLEAITSHFENREQKATETTISPPRGGVVVIRSIVTRVVTMWKQITTKKIDNKELEDMKSKKSQKSAPATTPALPAVPATPPVAPAKIPVVPAKSAVPKPAPAPTATAPGPRPATAPAAAAKIVPPPATPAVATKPTPAPAAPAAATKPATSPAVSVPGPKSATAPAAPAPGAPAPAPISETPAPAGPSSAPYVVYPPWYIGGLPFITAIALVALVVIAGFGFYSFRDQNVVHETSRAMESRIAAENAINSARRAEADAAIKIVEARAEAEKYKQERIVPQPYKFLVTPRTVVDLSTNTAPTAPTTAETNKPLGSVGHVTVTNFVMVVQQQFVVQQPPHHQQIMPLPAGVVWPPTPMIEEYGYKHQAQQGINGYFYFGR